MNDGTLQGSISHSPSDTPVVLSKFEWSLIFKALRQAKDSALSDLPAFNVELLMLKIDDNGYRAYEHGTIPPVNESIRKSLFA